MESDIGGDEQATLQLRRAEPGDELAVAVVHVRSWQVGYRDLLPAAYLDQLRPADRAAGYHFGDHDPAAPETVLAEYADQVAGFATIGPARDQPRSDLGELYTLYVHPDRWAHGIGRALIVDARHRLRRRGATTAILWVLVGNDRAQRFYRADGWRPDGRRQQEEVHGILADELCYGRDL